MLPRSRRQAGFTLVEMACAVALSGMLGLLLVSAWGAFGVPAVDSYRRGRLAREAMMAAAALADDLGGSLSSPDGRHWKRDDFRFVAWRTLDGNSLELWFDGVPNDGSPADGVTSFGVPDVAVTYWVDAATSTLLREDGGTGITTVVAGDVASMAVDPNFPNGTGDGSLLGILLTFQYRDFAREHTFIASKP